MISKKMVSIRILCPLCKSQEYIEVSEEGFLKWQEGLMIQLAFPELTEDQRERVLTGICSSCWDEAFPEEEE